jgi:hypothetical protein
MTALVLLAVAATDPAIFYSKSFPGSVPEYVEIHLSRDGSVVYKEKPDDDQPVKFALKPEEAEAMFSLADKLDHFNGKLESGLPVAKMGEKTFRWEQGTERYEQKFNYSTNEDARALQDWFEKITETEMHLFNLERTARFDKLGVNKTLLQLETSWDRRRLVAVNQFEPWLNRIVKNESYLNMDRERAGKLLELFKNPPPPPPSAPQQ